MHLSSDSTTHCMGVSGRIRARYFWWRIMAQARLHGIIFTQLRAIPLTMTEDSIR